MKYQSLDERARAVLTAYRLGGPEAARELGVQLPDRDVLETELSLLCWTPTTAIARTAISEVWYFVDSVLLVFIRAQLC